MLVVQLWKLTEVVAPIQPRDDSESVRSSSVPSEELESVSIPEFPNSRNENSPNRRRTVTDLIGDFELGDTILHESPDSLPIDAENFFQAEVTVQGHFSLDVSTSEVASNQEKSENLPKLPKSPVKKRKYNRKTEAEKLEIANKRNNAEFKKLPASPKRKKIPRKLIRTEDEKRKKKRIVAHSSGDIFSDLKNECSAAFERLMSLTLPSDDETEAFTDKVKFRSELETKISKFSEYNLVLIDQNPVQITPSNIHVTADVPTEIPDLITTG